ncbi:MULTISPECIES: hypothetical protein, partial [unclassified Microcoleus]
QWKQIGATRQPNGTLQVIGIGFDDESYRISQSVPGGSWGSWQKLFMGALPAGLIGTTGSTELRLTADPAELPMVSLADRDAPLASTVTITKTTGELIGDCALEFSKALLAFSKAYTSAQSGNEIEALAAANVTASLTTSAAAKCEIAIRQGIGDTSSKSSDSPDKDGFRGIEGGQYWDYVPGPGAGKILVA